MDDAGLEAAGSVSIEPVADAGDAGDVLAAIPFRDFGIAFELGLPAADLPLEIVLDLTEACEAQSEIILRAESGDAIDEERPIWWRISGDEAKGSGRPVVAL